MTLIHTHLPPNDSILALDVTYFLWWFTQRPIENPLDHLGRSAVSVASAALHHLPVTPTALPVWAKAFTALANSSRNPLTSLEVVDLKAWSTPCEGRTGVPISV